jgi:DNA polymerase V
MYSDKNFYPSYSDTNDERVHPLLIATEAHAGATGFPSPADDYMESQLDLNAYVNAKPHATFYVRARGSSMRDIGIETGDVLIVDRSLTPQDGDIAICVVEGELLVKRLAKKGSTWCLLSANAAYPPLTLKQGQELVVWGVVKGMVKLFQRGRK